MVSNENELSITNHEVHGFSHSFKNVKKPFKLIGQIDFCLQLGEEVLKAYFCHNHKGRYGASFKI